MVRSREVRGLRGNPRSRKDAAAGQTESEYDERCGDKHGVTRVSRERLRDKQRSATGAEATRKIDPNAQGSTERQRCDHQRRHEKRAVRDAQW